VKVVMLKLYFILLASMPILLLFSKLFCQVSHKHGMSSEGITYQKSFRHLRVRSDAHPSHPGAPFSHPSFRSFQSNSWYGRACQPSP
jgi:hypothetical protein